MACGMRNTPVHDVPLGVARHVRGHTTRASLSSKFVNPVDTNSGALAGVGDAVANGVGAGVGMIPSRGATLTGLLS